MAYLTTNWTVLADPTRREILDRLAKRSCSVSEVASNLPVSRSAVSQHLKVLKTAGLVVDVPSGKQRIYSVDPTGLATFRAELDLFWSKTLAAYQAASKQSKEDQS